MSNSGLDIFFNYCSLRLLFVERRVIECYTLVQVRYFLLGHLLSEFSSWAVGLRGIWVVSSLASNCRCFVTRKVHVRSQAKRCMLVY